MEKREKRRQEGGKDTRGSEREKRERRRQQGGEETRERGGDMRGLMLTEEHWIHCC